MEERIAELGSQPVAVRALECEAIPGAPGILRLWPAGEAAAAVEIDSHLATPPRLICAATALVAAEALLGPAQGEALARRLRTALLTPVPGRLDYRENLAIRGHDGAAFPVAVLDGGHNLPALNALLVQLQAWGVQGYTLIFGMQRDKLLPELAEPLALLFGGARRIITLPPATPRSPSTDELRAYINGMLEKAQQPPQLITAQNPREALLKAAQWPQDPLVVAGSFWMLGDLMAELQLP
jgi:folylpolyglutamate synthase/dihydropteroate synthase